MWKDILEEGSQWAYPREQSFKARCREVYKNYKTYKKWSEILKEKVRHDYAEEKITNNMSNSILEDGYLDGFLPYSKSNNKEDMIKNWRIEVGK